MKVVILRTMTSRLCLVAGAMALICCALVWCVSTTKDFFDKSYLVSRVCIMIRMGFAFVVNSWNFVVYSLGVSRVREDAFCKDLQLCH